MEIFVFSPIVWEGSNYFGGEHRSKLLLWKMLERTDFSVFLIFQFRHFQRVFFGCENEL